MLKRIAWIVCLIAFAVAPTAASDLAKLAGLHAVTGSEQAAAEYVRGRLGARAVVDNTGSVSATYGSGGPHILIAAGLDEPGYVVSGVDDEGYLRLRSLADPAPHYRFDKFFVGRPVRVGRWGRPALPGAVAAPSVHFASESGYSSRSSGEDSLFVDIGASSPEEVEAAGVRILDPVSLAARASALGAGGRIAGPWISSRAGAAVLLSLADRLAGEQPRVKTTLAFVARQHYHNAGLLRALALHAPDRVIVIRPGGDPAPGVAPASGWSSKLTGPLLETAKRLKLGIGRGKSEKLSFGPFGADEPWPEGEQAVVLTLGVEHSGTPVEVVSAEKLGAVETLLAAFLGLDPDPKQPFPVDAIEKPAEAAGARSELESLLQELVRLPGVSGAEDAVRELIRGNLPDWARRRAVVDEKGDLIVSLGEGGEPRAVFIAHMDEIGFEVKRIGSDGRLSVAARGGGDEDLFAWGPLTLWRRRGPLAALMARFGAADLGADSLAAAEGLGAEIGSSLTVPKSLSRLLGERISGRSLDDRVGCAVLLSALRSLEGAPRGAALQIVFSVEEEVGLLGADSIARRRSPARVYAVDSLVTTDTPLESRRMAYARLGGGAALRALDHSGMTPRAEVERVLRLARENGVRVQVAVTAGGNDGSKFVRFGAVNIPLSFPLRYSHSAVETADLRDVRALVRLVKLLIVDELRGGSILEPRP